MPFNTLFLFSVVLFSKTTSKKQMTWLSVTPLSPILCHIYMHYFAKILLDKYSVRYLFNYVDDSYVLFDKNDIISVLNSLLNFCWFVHHFSYDVKHDNKLWFQKNVPSSSLLFYARFFLFNCFLMITSIILGNKTFRLFVHIFIGPPNSMPTLFLRA